MKANMIDTKQVIISLKQVKAEKKLSLDKIVSLLEQNVDYVSKTTLSRVFAKGSEELIFKWENTLRPIANALLDIETFESDDDTDTKAFKSVLRLKKDLLQELEAQNKELKAELKESKAKYHEKLASETAKFQKSLDFAMNQIELKDKRIDQLMDANDRLSITNDRLIHQLMDCPLRKEC